MHIGVNNLGCYSAFGPELDLNPRPVDRNPTLHPLRHRAIHANQQRSDDSDRLSCAVWQLQ